MRLRRLVASGFGTRLGARAISSRSVEDLEPETRLRFRKFYDACRRVGINLLVTSTYRSPKEQAELYAKGRTAPGPIVTNAKPGTSYHNCRRAADVVPVINGKPVWDDKDTWPKVGAVAAECGLEWGGFWTKFQDRPHVQLSVCKVHGKQKALHFTESGVCGAA